MKLFHTLILTCLLSETFASDPPPSGTYWGYHSDSNLYGPPDWKKLFSSCGGLRQSPIDIDTSKAQFDEHLKPIEIVEIDHLINNVSFEKHRYSIYLTFNQNWKIMIGDKKCLKPVSIHWHFGSDDEKGSEHKLNGHAYPIEGHIVSYNCELYGSASVAKTSPDGLYVIGVFYKIGPKNEVLQKFLNYIDPIIDKTAMNMSLHEISPLQLLPKNLEKYYQYDGSLTTPPCTENVRWTVLKEELTIGEEQMKKFRELDFEFPESGKMVNNFRPIIPDPDNKRIIYSSFKSSLTLMWNKFVLLFNTVTIFSVLFYQ